MFLRYILLFYTCIILTIRGDDFCPSQYCNCLGYSVQCTSRKLRNIPLGISDLADKISLEDNNILNFSFESLVKFKDLKELSLLRNKLTKFPRINRKSGIIVLNLGGNRISSIKKFTCSLFPHLQELNLSSNSFTRLTNETFSGRSSLSRLYLSHNKISFIDRRAFGDLRNLKKLDLNNNLLESIPRGVFSSMPKLKKLKMTNNRLTYLTDGVFNAVPNLNYLSLRCNRIETIEDGVFHNLDNLKTLKLDKNNISLTNFQRFFGLNSLEILSLKENRISVVSASTWKLLSTLKKLYLSSNLLTYLPKDAFTHLDSLVTLKLDNNHITLTHPLCFASLRRLQNLDLRRNSFQWPKLTTAYFPASLTALDLSHNALRSVPQNALLSCNLKSLRLAGNQHIGSFESVLSLRNLTHFTMDSQSMICDCKLSKFVDFVVNFTRSTLKDLKCAFPSSLNRRRIIDVKSSLRCHNLTTPVIVNPPRPRYVLLGQSTHLRCDAVSPIAIVIKWRKNNTLLAPSSSVTTTTSEGYVKVESRLDVNATIGESSEFSCQVESDSARTLSDSVNITVLEMPSLTKKPIQRIHIRLGSTFQVQCEAEGSPAPKISWSKDGGSSFPAAIEKRMHVLSGDSIFYILNVSQADIGTYRCTAANTAGAVHADVSLHVLALPSFESELDEFTDVSLNVTLLLKCPSSNLAIAPLWLFNGQPIVNETSDYLILTKLQEWQIGDYTCVLSNSLGTARTTTSLRLMKSSKHFISFVIPYIAILIACILGTSLIWILVLFRIRRLRLSKRKASSNISLCDKDNSYKIVSRSDNDFNKSDGSERHDSGLYEEEEESSIDQSNRSLQASIY